MKNRFIILFSLASLIIPSVSGINTATTNTALYSEAQSAEIFEQLKNAILSLNVETTNKLLDELEDNAIPITSQIFEFVFEALDTIQNDDEQNALMEIGKDILQFLFDTQDTILNQMRTSNSYKIEFYIQAIKYARMLDSLIENGDMVNFCEKQIAEIETQLQSR